jgi:hypothetical protein
MSDDGPVAHLDDTRRRKATAVAIFSPPAKATTAHTPPRYFYRMRRRSLDSVTSNIRL